MYRVDWVHSNNEWDSFVRQQPYTIFVQAPQYADFYREMGEEGKILGLFDDDVLVGGSVIVGTHAKRGNFLFVPYGFYLPEIDAGGALRLLTQFLVSYAKEHAYHFLRVSPFVDEQSPQADLYRVAGFRSAPIHVLAETTWLLDCTKTDEDLLMGMNKNHRNLIRRCEKEGVRIVMDSSEEALRDFNILHDKTARRHHFVRFSESYISKEFLAFARTGNAVVFRAYLPTGELDSAAIVMYYGSMACYRHGASLGLNHKVPTSYLIQWKAMQEAKKRHSVWYNFWGIAPQSAGKEHPFFGITHFKTGFGGTQKDLLHCHDYVIHPWYYANWLVETIRRIKRGF